MPHKISILSIVPYRILPATSGGHLGIVDMHHHIGKLCNDNMAGTADNDDESKYSFTIHRIFPPKASRYLPLAKLKELKQLAKQTNAQYIYCDHPYMAPTAISLSKSLHIPWFMRSHNIESDRFRTMGKLWWRIMHWYEQYAMRKADGVFLITPEDKEWALSNYKLNERKCHIIPYGTNLSAPPTNKASARKEFAQETGTDASIPWLYFLGALNYQPNVEAVNYILEEIVPRLNAKGFAYKIFIAGKGLSDELQQKIATLPQVQYMGFIPVLDTFLNACDIMLNPVMTGGGIKTKAVEALGYNKVVVSSTAGAAGLMPEVCGNNLLVTPDYDWDAFTDKIIQAASIQPVIPQSFYDTYNWDKIAAKVLTIMQATKV
ncbi:hypothetical protein CAP35_14295 [Chitinophagaceae bacterium IBVUCB1]|nr:hypothetical protein CAP35_14295 [Chitinophagaceae bacterium IBVUCB1]